MMNNLIKIIVDIQNILIETHTVYYMEYRPKDECFMFRIRKEFIIFENIRNILAGCPSDLKWSINNRENHEFFEIRVGNNHKTFETYNPVEKAYDILVDGGDIEEAIGYLGEALAD